MKMAVFWVVAQCRLYKFTNQTLAECGLTISVQERKSMIFKGQDPIGNKIVINSNHIEQVNTFNYLGNLISYGKEVDIDTKLHNSLKITDIINNMFKPKKTLKKTTIKIYKTPALPVLLYGSENWTIKARDASRITGAGMKYARTAGYTEADRRTNTEITRELNITPILDRIYDYMNKWLQYVNRMPRDRLHRLLKKQHPKRKKEPERLLDV
jgi:hypothetical protein